MCQTNQHIQYVFCYIIGFQTLVIEESITYTECHGHTNVVEYSQYNFEI